MKKNTKNITTMLLCSLLSLSAFFISFETTIVSGSSAFVQYGTTDYAVYNATLMGGHSENTTSYSIAIAITSLLSYSDFDYIINNWGDMAGGTQPSTVYSIASSCENNYDSTVVYYKGHSYEMACPAGCGSQHYAIYDREGYTVPEAQREFINDYAIHNAVHNTGSGTHDVVFLWTCGAGHPSNIGSISNNHGKGMCASWMNVQDPYSDLSTNGYNSPDNGGRCFISFYDISLWYTMDTNYGTWNYGHFIYSFFNYSTQPGYTINMALDEAASNITILNSMNAPICETKDT